MSDAEKYSFLPSNPSKSNFKKLNTFRPYHSEIFLFDKVLHRKEMAPFNTHYLMNYLFWLQSQ